MNFLTERNFCDTIAFTSIVRDLDMRSRMIFDALNTFKAGLKKYSLYIEKHNLLIKYHERKRGAFRTLLAWGFVGYAVITFKYALDHSVPGPVALFVQSLSIISFPLIKCLFDDSISCLKVTAKISILPQHLSVSQRRWSIFIRGSLGILAGACLEYAKEFSSVVDNSTIFGADAIVVALFMRVILKKKIGIRWIWIIISLLGMVAIIYADLHSIYWLKSIKGAFFSTLSVVLLAIVLLMTSYMVHHDEPITIAFYQCLMAVAYSFLYLMGSIAYLFWSKDFEGINHYLSCFHFSYLKTLPILLLCSGGFLYGWALLLFFQSLYFTEILILATIGYFLAPIVSGFEWLFYRNPIFLKPTLSSSQKHFFDLCFSFILKRRSTYENRGKTYRSFRNCCWGNQRS